MLQVDALPWARRLRAARGCGGPRRVAGRVAWCSRPGFCAARLLWGLVLSARFSQSGSLRRAVKDRRLPDASVIVPRGHPDFHCGGPSGVGA